MFTKVRLESVTPTLLAQVYMDGQIRAATDLCTTPSIPEIREVVACRFICDSNARNLPIKVIESEQQGYFSVFGRV